MPTSGADAKSLRVGLNMTQRALAKALEVSDRMIRKIESAELIPEGYRETYEKLAGGRTVTPKRRTNAAGEVVVRAKGGGTVKVKPPKAGKDTGVSFAQGTGAQAPIVRRTVTWLPFRDTPGRSADAARTTGWDAIRDAVADAHRNGMSAAVTLKLPDKTGQGGVLKGPRGGLHRGGQQAGFDVIVTEMAPGAHAPRNGIVVHPGDPFDLETIYALADDAGLTYPS